MRLPRSIAGWICVVFYCGLAGYLLVQAFTCGDWVCDLVALPATVPFGLVYLAVLKALDPVYSFGDITFAPFRNWLFIVPTIAANAVIYYWLGVGIAKLIARFRPHNA